MSRVRVSQLVALTIFLSGLAACGGKKPPQTSGGATPSAFPGAGSGTTSGPPPVTQPALPTSEAVPPTVTVAPPVSVDPLSSMAIDDVNRSSPLKPVFFALDSDTLDDAGHQTLSDDAQILAKYPAWVVTVEGHCDERGSAEYNLALGDRRAQAARSYLISLGIAAERLRTVSYGNEFPFDPGHDESAWKQNRRAQFMVTAK